MQIEKELLEKSAETLVVKANDCFELAALQHDMAEKQHEVAARQEGNARVQQEIADRQHADADQISAKATKLDDLGEALLADAATINGETHVVQRGK